jgi:multiple antibiotic resistance protein
LWSSAPGRSWPNTRSAWTPCGLQAKLILLISALNAIFPRPESAPPAVESRSALQLALSPLASPVIVTPAGIAAIIVFELLAAQIPGGDRTIVTSLAVVMVLNFLVMFFNGAIVKIPGLGLALQLLGTVLVVVQVALAVQVLLISLEALGLVGGS